MAALDFPASPTNGQVFVAPSGVTYTFVSTPAPGYWKAAGGGSIVFVGTTPPPNAVHGTLWWNSETGVMSIYYNDGNTTQWVPTVPAGSIPGTRVLVSEAIAAAGNPVELRVNVPAGCRSFELEYECVLGTGTDQPLALQIVQGSGQVSAANYVVQYLFAAGSTAGGQYSTGGTYWSLGSGVNWVGNLKGQLANSFRSDNVIIEGQCNTLGNATARAVNSVLLDYYFGSNNQRQTITGFRFSAGGGFSAGSVVRAFAMV